MKQSRLAYSTLNGTIQLHGERILFSAPSISKNAVDFPILFSSILSHCTCSLPLILSLDYTQLSPSFNLIFIDSRFSPYFSFSVALDKYRMINLSGFCFCTDVGNEFVRIRRASCSAHIVHSKNEACALTYMLSIFTCVFCVYCVNSASIWMVRHCESSVALRGKMRISSIPRNWHIGNIKRFKFNWSEKSHLCRAHVSSFHFRHSPVPSSLTFWLACRFSFSLLFLVPLQNSTKM